MITGILFSWEVIAFILFFILWKFSRSFLKISDIKNRCVFITGCDSGFGRLLAESLDKKGVTVYAGCFSLDSVTDLKDKCSSLLKPIIVDVTDTKSVKNAVAYVENDLGDKALWAVVNNAGISGTNVPFEWMRKEDCQQILDVNLLGVFDVTLAFLPLIKRGKEGRIVNIASIYGRLGWTVGGYAMSKHAIEAFSDGLSIELSPYNITVHTLEPGFFRTGLVESVVSVIEKRWAELDEKMKQNYGENFCEKTCRFLTEFLNKAVSPKLELVVNAYEHALLAKYPSNRYVVGNDAKFFYIPASWFPFSFQKQLLSLLEYIVGMERPIPKDAMN